MYVTSDHLPLKWIRKCEKGFISNWTIENLSDLHWVHSYLPGPDNSLFDSLSRYLMLGSRVLAPTGLHQAVTDLLARLPHSIQTAHRFLVCAPSHSADIAR